MDVVGNLANMIDEKFYRHGPHLSSFRKMGDLQQHWDDKWLGSIKSFLEHSAKGELGEFEEPFTCHLDPAGPILEAGCGTGRYVAALRARGYNIEGIDYADKTIEAIRSLAPHLNVRKGDIFHIDRDDGFYAGYISIGVLEHTFDGPEAGLKEAHRVLRRGGVAVITVPQLNRARRAVWKKAPVALEPKTPDGFSFYQDHLDETVFAKNLQDAGFRIHKVCPYELFGGFIRNWAVGRHLNQRGFYSFRIRRWFKNWCENAPTGIKRRHSHMLAFVCEKA